MKLKGKVAFLIIILNLLIGNLILFVGGNYSSTGNVNVSLMFGLSISCILVYGFFFQWGKIENQKTFKLILQNIFCCIIIIFLGNAFALLSEDFREVSSNIVAVLLMGFVGNLIMFPISVLIGLMNFALMKIFSNNQ